jgi:hypothetical protein
MNKIKKILGIWLPFAVVICAFCALVYATVQQVYRQNANDPQIQMAEDAADALNNGKSVETFMPASKVSVAKSLAPFYVVYDIGGKVIASSVTLDGQTPELPAGVLDSTSKLIENRITWQPANGVRIATVIVSYKDGFVLAGRNMRDVEDRVAQLTIFTGLTLALALIATLVAIAVGEFFLAERK